MAICCSKLFYPVILGVKVHFTAQLLAFEYPDDLAFKKCMPLWFACEGYLQASAICFLFTLTVWPDHNLQGMTRVFSAKPAAFQSICLQAE